MGLSGSPYEATVFVDTYPSGKSWARDIDDFMRQLLSAIRYRAGAEHFWRNVGDTTESVDYASEVEGMHRPAAARAWIMDLNTDGIPVFSFGEFLSLSNELQGALNNALLAFKTVQEPTSQQMVGRWEGSTWVIQGGKLKPLISRLRGAVDFMGLMRFGPVRQSYHNQQLSGLTVDENLGGLRPQLDTPAPLSDAHTYECYYDVQYREHEEDTENLLRTIYPVRVGNFDKYGKNRPPGTGRSHALMWEVVNTDESGSGDIEALKMYLTARGIEFVTDPFNEDIFINGINLWKHDHSGDPGMGVPFDWSKATNEQTALTFSKYAASTTPRNINTINAGEMHELFTDEADTIFAPEALYPLNEDDEVENLSSKTRIFQFELIAHLGVAYDADRELTFVVAAEGDSYTPPGPQEMPNVIGCWQFCPAGNNGGNKKNTFTAIVPAGREFIAPANGKLHFYITSGSIYGAQLTALLAVTVVTWRR